VQPAPFLPPDRFVGFALPGVLEGAPCDALIGELTRRGFSATGADYPRDYRNNDRLVFDDPDLAARLFARVAGALPRELVIDGVTWRLHGLNPRFRACRYRDGQTFCIHRDGPHQPDAATRSRLTLQLYLDDGMRGGHTRFYADRTGGEPSATIAPRRGTAIVFDHQAWHDGEAVTGGTKHVLRTDVMYRRAAAPALASEPSLEPSVIGHHRGYAWRAIACRDGSIASGGRDGTVRRWRDRRAIAVHALGAGSVTALAEPPDGRLWCGTRSGRIAVITGDQVTIAHDGLGAVLAMATLPAGGVVVATSHGELVELAERTAPRVTRAHHGWAWGVAIRDGVVSCGDDGAVIEAGRRLARLDQPARALAVLPSGAVLVGTADGVIHELRGGEHVHWQAHDAAITSLAAWPGGHWASASEDGTVKRWCDRRRVRRLAARGDFVTSVAFRRDGALIVAGYDGVIWLDAPDPDRPEVPAPNHAPPSDARSDARSDAWTDAPTGARDLVAPVPG
jgi:hypothetical protein